MVVGWLGYAFVTRILLPIALAVALLAGGNLGAARGVDLLTGTTEELALCSLTPASAVDLFGIPSRAYVESGAAVIAYHHRGFDLRFAAEDAAAPLATITVYPVDRDGFMGYRGHFLGTIASGTAREPVKRILRSVQAEIVSDAPETLSARREGFALTIAFLYGVIDTVELACEVAADPAR